MDPTPALFASILDLYVWFEMKNNFKSNMFLLQTGLISLQRLFPLFSHVSLVRNLHVCPIFHDEFLNSCLYSCFHSVSCTVIHCSVFSLQLIHMQIEIRAVLRCCESALHWLSWALRQIWIIINNPFKSFSRCLTDPIHASATNSKPTAGTGQFVGSTWSHNYWLFRLCEHNLTVNTSG